jgi:hypothetical protein
VDSRAFEALEGIQITYGKWEVFGWLSEGVGQPTCGSERPAQDWCAVGAFRGLSNTQGSQSGKEDKKSPSPSHGSIHDLNVETYATGSAAENT